MTQEKQSMLASIGGSIGGPRFVEDDDVSLSTSLIFKTVVGSQIT